MIRTLIIDDERLARQRIKRLLQPFNNFIEILGECKSGVEALQQIRKRQPDLIFLDVQMRDMNGFEVLDKLPEEQLPTIVFITAYDKYAVQAFDHFAFDYLLKPLREDRFAKSVKRVIDYIHHHDFKPRNAEIQSLLHLLNNRIPEPQTSDKTTIAIKHAGKICFVEKEQVQYIEASGYYIEVFTSQRKYLIRETLQSILEKLGSNQFIRIHRSTIINTAYLKEINSIGFGDVEVYMKDNKVFRVSKSYKDKLFRKMGL